MKIEGDEKGETMPRQEKDVTYDQFVIIIITQRCKDTDVSEETSIHNAGLSITVNRDSSLQYSSYTCTLMNHRPVA